MIKYTNSYFQLLKFFYSILLLIKIAKYIFKMVEKVFNNSKNTDKVESKVRFKIF